MDVPTKEKRGKEWDEINVIVNAESFRGGRRNMKDECSTFYILVHVFTMLLVQLPTLAE